MKTECYPSTSKRNTKTQYSNTILKHNIKTPLQKHNIKVKKILENHEGADDAGDDEY